MTKKKSKNRIIKITLIIFGVLIGLMILISLTFVPILKRKAINYVEENTDYRLKIKSIVFTGFHSVLISGVDMRPKAEIEDFYKENKLERDWIGAKLRIAANGIDWSSLIWDKKLLIENIVLHEVDLYVYRDKRQPDRPYKKKDLHATILQKTKFIFTVPKVEIKKSRIEYREIGDNGAPINVVFSDLYGTLYHLSSDSVYMKNQPEVILDGEGYIMDTAKAKLQYKFSSLSKTDEFTFEGHVESFSATSFNKAIAPLITGVEIKSGDIKKVDLFFRANDKEASGKMAIEYEELKVDILSKKDPERKSKLKTFVSRIFIDKENKKEKGELDEIGKISCQRSQDKSLFNYWWKAIKSGLLSSLLEVELPNKKRSKEAKK